MTFLVGELASEIRLEGQAQYTADLDRMGSATGQLAAKTSTLTDGMRKGFQFAANTITAAAVGGAALGVSLFNTGAAYNTLQQTSRAALSTLLGGAEAANAQMDKLDAFARNSPFSKSVFIEAQQQLLGFGYEAEKVVPILDSVQNAVAAVGGNNQSISEIVSIFAKIRSSGKITAEDLNMLGERGLDAATLLGNGFGKSAQQIREDITKGTLDATQAVDVMVQQMDTKFAGAAANVKKTWVGTQDRIKAATREIGVALAEPFISQQGGGMAVQWGNQVADVLQGVRGHAQPVVSLFATELQPAFNGLTSALDGANLAVRTWDSARLETFLRKAKDYAPALAAVGGAVVGLNSGLLSGIPVINQFIPAINPLAGALLAVAATSPELRAAAGDLLGSFQPLIPVVGDLAKVAATGLGSALPVAASAIGLVTGAATPLVAILSAVPAPLLGAAAAFVAMRAAAGPLTPVLQTTLTHLTALGQQVQVQAALSGMSGAAGLAAGSFGVASMKAQALGGALKAAFISNPVGLVLLGVSTAVALLTAALTAQAEEATATKERVQGYRDTLVRTTGALTDATRAQLEKNLAEGDTVGNLNKLGISQEVYTSALLGNAAAQAKVASALEETRRIMALPSNERSWQEVFNDTYKAGKQLIDTYDQQAEALAAAEAATKAEAEAKRQAAAAASELSRSNGRLNDALAIARDVSKDATERLKALKLAMDELTGGTKTAAEAERDLNEQTDRLREVFGATNENGDKLAATLVNASGAIDTSTAAGRALFDETTRLNDQMLDAILAEDKLAKARGETGVSTERAAQVAQPYVDRLREIASESGLSQEQVDGLVQTMLTTPSLVAFLVDDNGTVDEKKQELLILAQQILATPDKQFEISNDDFPGLMEALRALGFEITTLPNGEVKVTKNGQSFDAVESSLNQLVRQRTASILAYVQTTGLGGVAVNQPPASIAKPSANGNLFGTPGVAQAFANGGFPTGLYPGGRPLYKFAEPETGWEAFISGRKGQEDRNLAIASEAVARFGGRVLTPAQLRKGVSGAQAAPQVSNDNRLSVTLNTADRGVPLVTEVMAVVRRLEARQGRRH